MPASVSLQTLRTFALVSALAILASLAVVAVADRPDQDRALAATCPNGFELVSAAEIRAEYGLTSGIYAESDAEAEEGAKLCMNMNRPEPFAEKMAREAELSAKVTAPYDSVRPGAYSSALRQRERIIRNGPRLAGTQNAWKPYGQGPLISNDSRFGSVNGLGLVELSGRVDSLDYDPVSGRLFSLVGTGGVWMSENRGETWVSIGDALPSQINGALAWTPAGGGTLVTVSGEHLHGGNTYTGVGAFWTNDLGKTWNRAEGVPNGALGFQVVVDPTNPSEVYVANGKGLYRSTDAGRTFVNVNLPTGPCAGKTDNQECLLANFVTDVVIRPPGGVGTDAQPPGTVLAVVGYRSGARPYPQDPSRVESPCNGLFRSATGEPGTFVNVGPSGCGSTPSGFTPFSRLGRTELGITEGRSQDHDYLYAIVQDAELLRGGVRGVDIPEGQLPTGPVPNFTSINGIYVSSNFGTSWTQMADTAQIAENPASGSALAGPVTATVRPGIQAWYNEWIKVDPTRQDAAGIPTRITFGLEEVWQNRNTSQPQNGPSDFKVIGRYFAGDTCLFVDTNLPLCPASDSPQAPTTTHPDQHDAIYVPDGKGGVTLVVGHDGGVNTQYARPGEEFDNASWGIGANRGFNTLLPYHAQMAKDGTVWMGLQDNGTAVIEGFRPALPGSPQTSIRFSGVTPPVPGGKTDHPFKVEDNPNNYIMDVRLDSGVDCTLQILKKEGSTEREITPVADAFVGEFEHVRVYRPEPGDYIARVRNFENLPEFLPCGSHSGSIQFEAQPAANNGQFMALGGDGTYVAVDPNRSEIAYGAIQFNEMRVTTDGGTSWRAMTLPEDELPLCKFVNPFVMDPTDSQHLMNACRGVYETTYGPFTGTSGKAWAKVFDLGTKNQPGVASSASSGTNPVNGMSAVDLRGDHAYVGYCGPCELINTAVPFTSGLATNVGGNKPPKRMTSDGWHIAAANGLPDRYITSISIDPENPATVYVALGGYANRQWRPPGSYGDKNQNLGTGHVYVSHDAGETFSDISANLPDAPAFWVELRGQQLIVGTQVGVFMSNSLGKLTSGAPAKGSRGGKGGKGSPRAAKKSPFAYAALDKGMPVVPISSVDLKPGNPNLLVAATFGRGVYTLNLGGCPGAGRSIVGNHVIGTRTNDVLRGTAGPDVICGLGGNDRLKGKSGNDVILGGHGRKTRDRLFGGSGNDLLLGQGGKDVLLGGSGMDRLRGQRSRDALSGGNGRDRLNGGGQKDRCVAGKGDRLVSCERRRRG